MLLLESSLENLITIISNSLYYYLNLFLLVVSLHKAEKAIFEDIID